MQYNTMAYLTLATLVSDSTLSFNTSGGLFSYAL